MYEDGHFNLDEAIQKWTQRLETSKRSRVSNSDLHQLILDIIRIRAGEEWQKAYRADFSATLNGQEGALHLGRYFPNQDFNRESANFNFETLTGDKDNFCIEPNQEFTGRKRFVIKVPFVPKLMILGGAIAADERYVPVYFTATERLAVASELWRAHKANPKDIELPGNTTTST